MEASKESQSLDETSGTGAQIVQEKNDEHKAEKTKSESEGSDEEDEPETFVRKPVPAWMMPQKTETVDKEMFGGTSTANSAPQPELSQSGTGVEVEASRETPKQAQAEWRVKNGSEWEKRPEGFIGPLRPRIEELTKLRTLGLGNLSTTYLVEEYKTGKRFAMKEYIKQDVERKSKTKDLVMEKYVLNKLYDCQRVSRLYETFKDEFSIYFNMEYLAGGELWSIIHCWGASSKFELKYYFYKLVLAVEEIHSYGIVHRDLKPENIMLTEDQLDLKLIDLATSWDILNPEMKGAGNGSTKRRVCYHFIGTPQYMPPESYHNRGSYYQTDIYALGMILYQLICGFPPYLGGEWTIFKAAEKGELKFYEFFQEDEKDLILKMTKFNYEERISISEIKSHQFFQNGNKDLYEQKAESLEILSKNRTDQENWLLAQRAEIIKTVASVDANPPANVPEVAEEDLPDPSLPLNHPDNKPPVKYRLYKKELISSLIKQLIASPPELSGDYTQMQLISKLKQLKRQVWHHLKLQTFEHAI